MPGKLRIFISSTMEDLENERDELVAALREANFEPVNAEAMLPNSATSWDRISDEIQTCHVFVLLSGVRYGWIPPSGALSGMGVSVTHGEYLKARDLGLPVLPFFKILKYGSDAASEDARRRDDFRKQVADWETGHFRTEFSLSRDLKQKAVSAVTALLGESFQRDMIARRREATKLASPPQPPAPAIDVRLPPGLVAGVEQRKASLWVGSGISLRAGLPSAAAFAAELARRLQDTLPHYLPPAVGSGIATVATDFELTFGRAQLLAAVRDVLELPGDSDAPSQHGSALRLFPRIITTNYDRLFQRAAAATESGHAFVAGPRLSTVVPDRFVWNIHGGLDATEALVVTEDDIACFEAGALLTLEGLRKILAQGPLLVDGTSLRDPSILRLFRELRGSFEGYWSVPPGDPVAVKRAVELGIMPVEAPIDGVVEALTRRIR
jgi:hypothetical protein